MTWLEATVESELVDKKLGQGYSAVSSECECGTWIQQFHEFFSSKQWFDEWVGIIGDGELENVFSGGIEKELTI